MLSPAWLLATALAVQPSAQATGDPPATSVVQRPAATTAPESQSPAPADDRTTAPHPLRALIRDVGQDFKHLPSRDTLLIAGVGTGVALGIHPADDNFHDWLIARGKVSYVKAGNTIGDGWVHSGLALGTWTAGLVLDDARATHVGSDLIRAQFLNAVLTRGMKLVAQRERPSGSPDSMPSGHTSATFATAAVLHEHFGWKAGVAGYTAAGFVGWSRLRDDHHWLTDIVIGTAVGLVSGRTVTAGHRATGWTVVPVATHTTVAVYFVR